MSACPGPTSCRRARWLLTRLDAELIQRGLMLAPMPPGEDEEEDDDDKEEEFPPTLADKLRLLFEALYPERDTM